MKPLFPELKSIRFFTTKSMIWITLLLADADEGDLSVSVTLHVHLSLAEVYEGGFSDSLNVAGEI